MESGAGGIGKLASFASIIGNDASLVLECHSERILFQSSTVLDNKQDAYSMTLSLNINIELSNEDRRKRENLAQPLGYCE